MHENGFADLMAREKERLDGELAALEAQKTEIDDKIAALKADPAFVAIAAYQRAVNGELPANFAPAGALPARVPAGTNKDKGTRGSVQPQVLAFIEQNPGLTPSEITEKLGMDKQRVSNALSALKAANKVVNEKRRYTAMSAFSG